jgi:parallel beta-helix repeat protein
MFKKPIKKNNDQDEVLIEPPMKGKKISLNKIINSAPDGSLIKLTDCEYLIDETIVINKPVRLCGEGSDKTIITGNGLALLLESEGGNNIELKDISFVTNSEEPTTAVEMSGGEVNITACSFTGGVYSADDISGNGVFVRGNAQVSIIDSQFFENQESGLRIGGNVQAIVKKCKFMRNDSGLAVSENATIEVSNCDFTEDHVGFAFDDSATGVISENRIFKNRAGSMAKGSSTPKITNNQFNLNDISIG